MVACGKEHLWGGMRDLTASWTSPRPASSAARSSFVLYADREGSASHLESGIIKISGFVLFVFALKTMH